MCVCVDKTRSDDASGIVDTLFGTEAALDIRPRAHICDSVGSDRDGSIFDDAALRIHCEHPAGRENVVRLLGSERRNRETAQSERKAVKTRTKHRKASGADRPYGTSLSHTSG